MYIVNELDMCLNVKSKSFLPFNKYQFTVKVRKYVQGVNQENK